MNLNDLLESLNLDNNINLEDIPELDLYMDQVIQLFENKLGGNKRFEEDKILTKTMINNYAKGKLLMDIKIKSIVRNILYLCAFYI